MNTHTHELVQMQRYNSEEVQKFFSELADWEKEVKMKDEEIKRNRLLIESKENKAAENVTDFSETFNTTLDLGYQHEKNVMENKSLEMESAIYFKDLGNKHFKEELYHEAIECYTKGILQDSKNAVLLANRAMAYLKIGKFESAEEDCTNCIHIEPYVKAFLRRGVARVALEKYNCAKEDFVKVLNLEPKNKQALMELDKLEKLLAGAKQNVSPVLNQHSKRKDSSNSAQEKNSFEKSLTHVPPVLPCVPETSYQFFIDWRRLKAFPNLQYNYLKQFAAEKFPVLFQKSMEPDLFSGILRILSTFFIRNGDEVFTYLKYLSQIGRFQMLLMMLSPHEIKGLDELMNYMQSSKQHMNEMDYIVKLYKIA